MIANLLARLLLPRLRDVDTRTLRKFKAALGSFNAHTARWRTPSERADNPSN